MRLLLVLVVLILGAAPVARAQGSRISGPIDKARSAAAAASARTETQQREGLAAGPRDSTKARRDSVQRPGPTSAASATKTNAPIQSAANAAATKTGPASTKTASATPPANGKSAAAQPQPSPGGSPAAGDPTRASSPNAAVAPSGKAPRTAAAPPASRNAPPAAAPRPVTPPVGRPSTTVEPASDTGRRGFGPAAPKPDISISRETYSYDQAGRRDPFISLLQTDELRPLLTDLLLVGVAWDPRGRNSTATMRDVKTKEQYRAREGQLVGRMRVTSIGKKEIVFTIEEFGFSRQEKLVLGDTSKVRK